MKKRVFGKKLKRDVNERKALFKGLMSSLVLNERIETTESKAKAIKAEVDKLVTKAKKEEVLARRLLSPKLTPEALNKMLKDIAPRFSQRQGGYTRIVRMGKRMGDDAEIVIMEWTEVGQKPEKTEEVKTEKKPEMKNKKETKPKKAEVKSTARKPRRRTRKSE